MSVARQDVQLRHELLGRIHEARHRSDELFGLVKPDALCERPIPERHRIIFYVGHLEAFDWNLLHERVLNAKAFHADFDRLFAFGIDPVGGGLPDDKPSDWPDLAAVRDYVQRVRSTVDQRLEAILSPGLRPSFELKTLLNVAIEHRLMHVETLAFMLHQLPPEKKVREYSRPVLASQPAVQKMIEIAAGSATLGLPNSSGEFGWDNEFEANSVDVPAFEIDEFMISNGEFLEFINSGGYGTREFWTDDDWQWKSESKISHPVFWTKSGDQWRYRTMFEEIALPLDWPVYVSHAEASAYARWAGKYLPTEAEWHRAAYGNPANTQRRYPWGNEGPNARACNADLVRWDPAPVNAFPAGGSAYGVQGMLGNGWEWTSTEFAPFPGFQPFPFYTGYSANFFDDKHFVMKGGSPRTAACMLRPSFRNWFQPHYQYVYAGFRCVRR